jgi:GNAT superfamily N-acetyltransferase
MTSRRTAAENPRAQAIETYPLTPDRWRDFAAIMNARFDTRRCWCMAPRSIASYRQRTGEASRRAIKKVVDTAPAPPGVIAYVDGAPAGWCAVAPREEFPGIDARVRRVEAEAKERVWSVVCFSVLRPMRGRGLSRRLLLAAIELAAQHGATVVEAYPVENTRNLYRGVPSVYANAGFVEVARPQPTRPIVRYCVRPRRRRRLAT